MIYKAWAPKDQEEPVIIESILTFIASILQKELFTLTGNAQCADSEVRNAIERTPYVVVLIP